MGANRFGEAALDTRDHLIFILTDSSVRQLRLRQSLGPLG